jgi:hypothetical protein
MWIRYLTLVMTVAATAAEGLLYVHPPLDNHGGFSGEGSATVREWADSFVLGTTSEIGAVRWWGGSDGRFAPNGDAFVVRFFADDGGKPGGQLFAASAGPSLRAASGLILDATTPGFVYEARLGSPLRVEANQRYWFSVVNTGNTLWQWQSSSMNLSDGILRRNVGEAWGDPYGNDAAFGLIAVPEPKTSWLVCAGAFLLMGKFGLRRKTCTQRQQG